MLNDVVTYDVDNDMWGHATALVIASRPCPRFFRSGSTNRVTPKLGSLDGRASGFRPSRCRPLQSPREKHPFAGPTAATQKQTGAKRCAGETHTGRHRCVPRHDQPVAHSCGCGIGTGRGGKASANHHTTVHNQTTRQARNRFQVAFSRGAKHRSGLHGAAVIRRSVRANILRKSSLNLTCKRAERSDSEAASPHVANQRTHDNRFDGAFPP